MPKLIAGCLTLLLLCGLAENAGAQVADPPEPPYRGKRVAVNFDSVAVHSLAEDLEVVYDVLMSSDNKTKYDSASCWLGYNQLTSCKTCFVPTLSKTDQTKPLDASSGGREAKKVLFKKPADVKSDTLMKVKATWLKSNGQLAFSVERTGKLSDLASRRLGRDHEEDKNQKAQPRITVYVPEEPVAVNEWLSGTIVDGTLTSITINCGNGPQPLPPSNIQHSGENFYYHFGGIGQPGKTCLVCITASNPFGSTTFCYYITFRN